MTKAHGESGFTLIEVLIAAAVLGIVGLMSTPLLNGAAAGVRLGTDARNLSLAIAAMESRTQANHPRPQNMQSATTVPDEALDDATLKGSEDPAALNNSGQALALDGHPDLALPRLERAAALAPGEWLYRFNLAHAAGELGQWDRAVSEYREAMRLVPNDYRTEFNLAMALHKKGDEAAAIPEFQKAIALAPGEPGFHVSLGVSLEAAGRVDDAVAEFQRYLDLVPSAPDAQPLKTHVEALVAAQGQHL